MRRLREAGEAGEAAVDVTKAHPLYSLLYVFAVSRTENALLNRRPTRI